jgi:uncharacterized membrane protein YphA (DoxX/SURF4 family)
MMTNDTSAISIRSVAILLARLVLIVALVYSGITLIAGLAFPSPDAIALARTWGQMRPIDYLNAWTGFSRPYQLQFGIGQLLAAGLLAFRRTTTPGALLAAGLMAHAASAEIGFASTNAEAVSQSSASVALLGVATFLVLFDLRRIANVLLLGKPSTPNPYLTSEGVSGSMRLLERRALGVSGMLALLLVIFVFEGAFSAPKPCVERVVYVVDGFVLKGV